MSVTEGANQSIPMKMVMAVYNIGVDEDITAAMEELGVTCFTKIPRVIGTGKTTGPRLDDAIWPGANAVAFFMLPANKATQVMEAFRYLRKTIGQKTGIKAFLLNIEDFTA